MCPGIVILKPDRASEIPSRPVRVGEPFTGVVNQAGRWGCPHGKVDGWGPGSAEKGGPALGGEAGGSWGGGWGEHDSSGEHRRPSPWENAKMGSGMVSTLHKAWLTASLSLSRDTQELVLLRSPLSFLP